MWRKKVFVVVIVVYIYINWIHQGEHVLPVSNFCETVRERILVLLYKVVNFKHRIIKTKQNYCYEVLLMLKLVWLFFYIYCKGDLTSTEYRLTQISNFIGINIIIIYAWVVIVNIFLLDRHTSSLLKLRRSSPNFVKWYIWFIAVLDNQKGSINQQFFFY